jgi:hypothetical protein
MAVKFEGAAADRWPSEETRDWVFVAGVGGDQRLSRPAIHLPDPGHSGIESGDVTFVVHMDWEHTASSGWGSQ